MNKNIISTVVKYSQKKYLYLIRTASIYPEGGAQLGNIMYVYANNDKEFVRYVRKNSLEFDDHFSMMGIADSYCGFDEEEQEENKIIKEMEDCSNDVTYEEILEKYPDEDILKLFEFTGFNLEVRIERIILSEIKTA